MCLYVEPDGHFASPLYLSDLLPPASRILFEDTEVGESIYLSIYLSIKSLCTYVCVYIWNPTDRFASSLYLADTLPPASRILFDYTKVKEPIYLFMSTYLSINILCT